MNTKRWVKRCFFLILIISMTLSCRMLPVSLSPQAERVELPPAAATVPGGTDHPIITDEPVETIAAPPPADWKNNWLHFGVDNQFSSHNPNETQIGKENVANLEQIAGLSCNDGVFAIYGGTPAIYHGRIIITYAGGQLESGDPYTGEMTWRFGESAYGWAPPPVVSTDGIIYYLYVTPDASTKLFAVDAETSQQIWEAGTQFKTGFNFDAQVTVDEKNDLVYIVEGLFGDGLLYAVDRSTGENKWAIGDKRQQLEKMTFNGSIVPLQNDKLYVPAEVPATYSKQERMVRVDPLTQEVDLQYDIPEGVDHGWEVGWYGLCNDRLIESYREYSNPATILAAHPLGQSAVAWQVNVPGQSGRLACDTQKGIVYIPTDEGLLALEASTGKVIWDHQSIKSVFTPTIANGIIYYISDTNMYALDQEDGSQLFRYPLGIGADPSTGVAVNDGLVLFSGSGGTCDLVVLGLK